MRDNIKELFKTVSGYRIVKDTGIPQSTISRIVSGETEIGKARFEVIEKLDDYYLKLKEENRMNIEELQSQVKDRIHLSESNGRFYAVIVEENGDEHDLAQADNVDDLREQLKQFGQVK